jgi:hypothetical protein
MPTEAKADCDIPYMVKCYVKRAGFYDSSDDPIIPNIEKTKIRQS